ncbi:DUF3298 and DUF4163 domain-containing protein [Hymenobacter persicinus]|uniref:DUF3298 domain-containing protein n=1 Tax=Hymenobacter persicinus TaxID=2025506 RepID=A0A4Q5L8D2_9BACT|nr:DUF3298 and DUF4163 domain-containing protein [Hymenobacter persicinus]RYU77889.1 DUF3298 domain-containing protein [Hymenobacter persicinus]
MIRRSCLRASLGALTALAACQSHPDSAATADQTAAPTKATVPAPVPASADSAGTWYRTYRAALGPGDSITLHLQRWPQLLGADSRGHFFGSYSHADGEPLIVDGNTVADPDSVVLRDQSLTTLDARDQSPVWRLKWQGTELVGTRAGRALRLRAARPAGSLVLQSIYRLDSLAAFPQRREPTAPYARWSLHALQTTAGPAAVDAALRRALHGDTLDSQPAPTLDALFRAQGQLSSKDYRREANAALQQLPPNDAATFPAFLNYEDQRTTEVFWNQGGLLSFGVQFYGYGGGAHGNYNTSVVTLNARTGRALRYADIFRPGVKGALQELLGRYVRRSLAQPPGTPLEKFLFVKQMPVTHNVYLTSGGAVFVYGPYEIASYAQGEVQVYVPFRALQPLLQPGLPVGAPAS